MYPTPTQQFSWISSVWETQLLNSNFHGAEGRSKIWRLVLVNIKRQVWKDSGWGTALNKLNVMTGSGRKFFTAKLYAWLGEVRKGGKKKKRAAFTVVLATIYWENNQDIWAINLSLHFGSIMQASKACKGNLLLTYKNTYTHKKMPMKAVTSFSEMAECFLCRT